MFAQVHSRALSAILSFKTQTPFDKLPVWREIRKLPLSEQRERLSDRGDDMRLNQDLACMPHDEMSIAINPTNTRNVLGGANDYRLGWASSGFYASTDGGYNWYDGGLRDDDLPGAGVRLLADDDDVAVEDARLDHRVAAHAQEEVRVAAERLGDGDLALDGLLGEEWTTRGDASDEGKRR